MWYFHKRPIAKIWIFTPLQRDFQMQNHKEFNLNLGFILKSFLFEFFVAKSNECLSFIRRSSALVEQILLKAFFRISYKKDSGINIETTVTIKPIRLIKICREKFSSSKSRCYQIYYWKCDFIHKREILNQDVILTGPTHMD